MGLRDDSKQGASKKIALGKGFSSLLGLEEGELGGSHVNSTQSSSAKSSASTKSSAVPSSQTAPVAQKHILDLAIDAIEANPQQPRKMFDDQALASLAASIRVDGVLQPVVVSKLEKPGRFMLVAGERRWRASKLAGMSTIPAIVKEGTSEDLLRLALIENIQRQDLNVIEEAEAYSTLIKDYGLTQDQCASKVGKDRSTVTNALRLLQLPREIQDDLVEGRLTMGHGRALLSLDDKKLMLRARDLVIKKSLNVRQTELLCKDFAGKTADSLRGGAESSSNADLEYLSESLRGYLRTKVKIQGSGSRGKIEISYFTAAELERLVSQLGVDLK